MERFDDVVTDRDVRLADVERYLETATATDRFADRYRVAATGGTTGRRGVFLADAHEWIAVLASYSRAYAWAGLSPGLTDRPRMAVMSSLNPTHQSSIVGATVASRFMPTLRLDAITPMMDIVSALNQFRPDALVGYASILRELAQEQAAGRLLVQPRAVMSASEVLTDDARSDDPGGVWRPAHQRLCRNRDRRHRVRVPVRPPPPLRGPGHRRDRRRRQPTRARR